MDGLTPLWVALGGAGCGSALLVLGILLGLLLATAQRQQAPAQPAPAPQHPQPQPQPRDPTDWGQAGPIAAAPAPTPVATPPVPMDAHPWHPAAPVATPPAAPAPDWLAAIMGDGYRPLPPLAPVPDWTPPQVVPGAFYQGRTVAPERDVIGWANTLMGMAQYRVLYNEGDTGPAWAWVPAPIAEGVAHQAALAGYGATVDWQPGRDEARVLVWWRDDAADDDEYDDDDSPPADGAGEGLADDEN